VLIETTFRIGGILMVGLAAALLAGYWAAGLLTADAAVALPLAACGVVGLLFFLAGRDARRARVALLELGDRGSSPAPPRPGDGRP
jgi:hypothetical protein